MDETMKIDFIERRKKPRKDKTTTNKVLHLQLAFNKFAKSIFSTMIGKVVFLSLFIVVVSVSYWSLKPRMYTFTNNLFLLKEKNRLLKELHELTANWSEKELQQIEKSISDEQARIFDDLPSLARWLKLKGDYAKTLGLHMSYTIQDKQNTKIEKTYSLPVNIILRIEPSQDNSAYLRVLEYIHSLIGENRHLEIDGNEIISSGKEIVQVKLDIHLWVRSPNNIILPENSNHSEQMT
jgi:hypothetical protein